MNNQWIARILGVLFLAVFMVVFFQLWFSPPVPPQLQPQPEPQQTVAEHESDTTAPLIDPRNGSATITLTSLETSEMAERTTAPEEASPKLVNQNAPQQNQPMNTPAATKTAETIATTSEPTAARESAQKIWIQAGSFGSPENAQRRMQEIKKAGLAAEMETVSVQGKTYHRVYIGPVRGGDVDGLLNRLSVMGINGRAVSR